MSAWTADEKRLLAKYAAAGMSGGDIAEKFGRTRNAVCGAASRFGIKLLGPNGGNTNRKGTRKEKPKPSAVLWGSMSVDAKTAKSIAITASSRKGVRGGKAKKPIGGNVIPMKPRPPVPAPKPIRPEYIDPAIARADYDAAAPKVGLLQRGPSACRYPVEGEKEHTLFCGHQRFQSRPYCFHHCQRMFLNFACREEAAA